VQSKAWSVLFGVVLLASLGLFVVAPFVDWWLPTSFCSYGPGIYLLFYIILGVTAFFFILTEALLVYNMWAFAGEPGKKSEYVHGNHKLEMFWTAVPGGLLVLLGLSQVPIWHTIKSTLPEGSDVQVMEVSARQFEWRIRYPSAERMKDPKLPDAFAREARDDKRHADDIHVVNAIHIWKGAKVRVSLKSRDVLHSFFLPNIPTKQDAVPGKTIPVWFDVDLLEKGNYAYDEQTGTWKETEIWELACAELCGWGHYKMRGKFYVHKDKADFIRWLEHTAAAQNQTLVDK
jgi:cytochrome c oxidase subunit 2